MKRLLILAILIIPSIVFAVPKDIITFEFGANDDSQTVDWKQSTAPRLVVKFTQGGVPYRDLVGWSAKFFYAVDITVTPFVSITTTNFNRGDGEAIFDLTTANLNTNGSFIGVIQLYNAAGRPFFTGEFNVEIETAPFNTGAAALTMGDTVDYSSVSNFLNVSTNGPYTFSGGGQTPTTNSNGSLNIDIPGGGSSYTRTFLNSDLIAGILTVTNGLGTDGHVVQVYNGSNNMIFPDETTRTSSTITTIDLSSFAPISYTGRVVIVGVSN